MAKTKMRKALGKAAFSGKGAGKAKLFEMEPLSDGEDDEPLEEGVQQGGVDEEDEDEEEDGYSSPSVLETGDIVDADIGSDLDEEGGDEGFSSEEDPTDNEAKATALQARVSFATLAKVQDSLVDGNPGRKRKRENGDEEAERKLQALRERLKELKGGSLEKNGTATTKSTSATALKDSAGIERPMFSADSSDDDSEDQPAKKKGRSSKHAPTEMSSKRAVTRRRDAVEMKKSTARDPRFDPLSGDVDHHVFAKKYAFLDTYRTSEIATLKKAMKNKKIPDEERDAMKRQMVSMESKMAFEKGKEREAKILREHRKEEKKRVEEGKGVWHVKRSVVREQALKERFEGMKGRQRDKVIERRRKKLTAKERRGMPEERRG